MERTRKLRKSISDIISGKKELANKNQILEFLYFILDKLEQDAYKKSQGRI